MASIDLEALLQPIADDQPGGPSLEGDADYMRLEIAATRKPEVEVGGVVSPAEEPDWPTVRDTALALLGRTKDLQVAILLTESLIGVQGLEGMRSGLQLIRGLLDQHWDHVHPELDPDDPDGAASLRLMRLKNLGDRSRIVRALRRTPLVGSRLHGEFSLADVKLIAKGLDDGDEGAGERQSALDDSFQAAEVDQLRTELAMAGRCREDLAAIVDLVDERSDVREDLRLQAVDETLGEIEAVLEERLIARGVAVGAEEDEDVGASDEGTLEMPPASTPRPSAMTASAPRGPITSRDDAVKSLDQVCRYFEQHEPSSPVPLLLRRAKRLVAKDFMAILADLAPDGVDDARRVVGDTDGNGSVENDDDD